MSTFDTDQFLNMTTEDSLDDRLDPCPEGEYPAIASKPEISDFVYKKGEREGETGYRMTIRWDIQDEGVLAQLGRDKVTVRQSALLDITPDGKLDVSKGKNVQLGAIRTALGQNEPGRPWSPAMIEGCMAKVVVKQEVYNGNLQSNVVAVRNPNDS